jgi:hypothetical protein
MFSISGNRGFQMTFENGYTVSVQFGTMNYCDNKDVGLSITSDINDPVPDCKNAETALINPDGEFVHYLHKQVQGHMTPDKVLDLLNHARDLPQYVKKKYC